MQKYLKIFFICFCFVSSRSQNDPLAKNLFINSDLQLSIDHWHIKNPDHKFHSDFKPYLSGTISKMADSSVPFKHYMIHNFFLSKIFNDAPEKINQWIFQIHPIVDAVAAYDALDKKIYHQAIGGANIKLGGNNDFVFSGTAYGGNVSLPFYMDSMYKTNKIIPGMGQVYGDSAKGYQVFDYNGYISYSPHNNKIFNFQVGRDKHFIGDGYRSVLLSDYANPCSYIGINTNLWHFQYNVWYTMMNDISGANGVRSKYQKKYATFHYLSWNILKELNIGIFENVVWRGTDSNQVRTFDVNYLNPFIFYRPQEYSVGSPDNSFIGLNINARIAKTVKLYGQLGLDEFLLSEIRKRRGWWANKQAWQLGLNYINAIGVKGLNFQVEYNEVRPYTYSHGVVSQNYAHYGLALAHPYGANFKEYLGIINYRKDRWQLSIKGIYAEIGKDSLGSKTNMGQNIFKSYVSRPYEFGHKTTQGDKNTVLQSDIRFTYYIIPNINARIELGYIQRSERSAAGYALEQPYIYFGFRTSFWNMYND